MRELRLAACFLALGVAPAANCLENWFRVSDTNLVVGVVSSDGSLVAAGTNVIKLFRADNGQFIRTLGAFHRNLQARGLQFDRSSNLLLANNSDYTKVFRVSDSQEIFSLAHVMQGGDAYLSPIGDLFLFRPNGPSRAIELPSGRIRFTLPHSVGPFSNSGDCFVANPQSGRISLMSPVDGSIVRTLPAGTYSYFTSYAFSSDDSKLAISANSGINVWDLIGGGPPVRVGPFNPDPGRILFLQGNAKIGQAREGTDVFDLATGTLERTLPVFPHNATLDGMRLFGREYPDVVLWDCLSWSRIDTKYAHDSFSTFDERSRPIKISPKNELVAVGGRILTLFDNRTHELLYRLEDQYCNAIDFSPDGRRIAIVNEWSVEIRDARTGFLIFTFPGPSGDVGTAGGNLDAKFSPDGQTVAIGGGRIEFGKGGSYFFDCNVRLYSLSNGQLLFTTGEFPSWVTAVHFSPDGRFLYGAGGDVRKWRLSDYALTSDFEAPFGKAVFSSGRVTWVAGQLSGNRILLVNADTGEQRFLQADEEATLAFSHDGKKLLEMRYLTEVNLDSPEILVRLLSNGRVIGRHSHEVGSGVVGIDFADEGKQMAYARQDPAFFVSPTPPLLK